MLKLKTKKIKEISKYDPIDLFNVETKACVKKAIENLSKNPQNNMKLFVCQQILRNQTYYLHFNIYDCRHIWNFHIRVCD